MRRNPLDLLGANERIRTLVLGAAAAVVTLLVTQLLFPGAGSGRGTPAALVFRGLIDGILLAIPAVGIIVVYRALRVINFAQGPIGFVGAQFGVFLIILTDVPFLLAVLAGILLSMILGTIVGLFTLRFAKASRLFLTVVTIFFSLGFFFLIPLLVTLPIFPRAEELTPAMLNPQPDEFRRMIPFAGLEFNVGSFDVAFGFADLFALELGVLALLAIVGFFRYTKSGVAVRAMSENPERASLLGIGVGGMSVVVWTIAGALAGAGTIAGYVATLAGGGGALGGGSEDAAFAVLLPVFAAAVVGGFSRVGITVFASVLIQIGQRAWAWSFNEDTQMFNVVLFVLILGGLLLHRRKEGRSETSELSWSATDEPRPVPKELAGITSLRLARLGIIGSVVAASILFPFVVTDGLIFTASVILVNAIAVLSLVVLTGWAGQVSLGQYAFVAVGAVVGGALTSRAGVPFWIAVPVTAALCAGLAALIGLPALRIKGLFLMVATFGFAVAVQAVLFDDRYFGWLLPESVERPTLFFLDFENNTSMYFLCVASLIAAVVVVTNLRRSRTGRMLIAARENEANVAAFGISVLRAKLTAFAISGALCGFAGALYAHQQRGVAIETFGAAASVDTFVAAVIGGVASPLGALLGSAFIAGTGELLPSNQIVQTLNNGPLTLLILFALPGGLVSGINMIRDSVLRIVAQRRQIVVPSLFADYDPDMLERRLIPLGEPSSGSGLSALPVAERFALVSELYQGRGQRTIEKLAPAKVAKDQAALTAAVRNVEGLELNGDGDPHDHEAIALTPEATR